MQTASRDAFYSFLIDGLTPAFMYLRRAAELVVTPDAPSLTIRSEFDSFYSKLWTAYRERFFNLARVMGYNIGFLFAEKKVLFEQRGKKFFETHKLPIDELDWLRANRNDWQNKLSSIRNKVIEHPTIPLQQAQILYTVPVAELYFERCWDVVEVFTALLMSLSLPADLEMVELPPPYEQHRRFTHYFKPGTVFSLLATQREPNVREVGTKPPHDQ